MIEFELLKQFLLFEPTKRTTGLCDNKKRSTVSKRDGFRFVGFKRAYR